MSVRLAPGLAALALLGGCHARLVRALPQVEALRPVVLTPAGELSLAGPPAGELPHPVHLALLRGLAGDLDQRGPAPARADAPWPLVVQVRSFGLDDPTGADPGDLFLMLRLRLDDPTGARVYQADHTCRVPLAELVGPDEASRLSALEALVLDAEPALQAAFVDLGLACGAWLGERLRWDGAP